MNILHIGKYYKKYSKNIQKNDFYNQFLTIRTKNTIDNVKYYNNFRYQ